MIFWGGLSEEVFVLMLHIPEIWLNYNKLTSEIFVHIPQVDIAHRS